MPLDLTLDCHMHSNYSDGSHTLTQVVEGAIKKKLATIAVTDHMPLPYSTRYAMDILKLDDYRRELRELGKTYSDRLTVLTGMEMEYIPEHRQWIKEIRDEGWDILLISIHGIDTHEGHFMINGREDEFREALERVFHNDIRAFCTRYYELIREAVETGWFDVVGHLDVIKKHNAANRYFDENDTWYRDQVLTTLDLIADAGLRMEINTNGINHAGATPYPSPWIIEEAKTREISLVLGSDAHAPRFQGQYFNRFETLNTPGA